MDYIILDTERLQEGPALLARNRFGIAAFHDADHGGLPGRGRGAPWLRQVLAQRGLSHLATGRLRLLTQPRVLGHVFNPVSFWLVEDADGALRAVVAEVTNTFGDRHAYLCHRDDLGPIGPRDRLSARKAMHVSPFQPVEGRYEFTFDIRPDRVAIRIDYAREGGGVVATLAGSRRALTNRGILSALLRRPFGSVRVLGLIHWQALRLWRMGARYRPRPDPPRDEVS